MPALNFHAQFVDAILAGEKTHTIRSPRKYPIEKGQTLSLYTAQRTKYCRKLMDVTCKKVLSISINAWSVMLRKPGQMKGFVESFTLMDELDAFARSDGFKDWQQMRMWWMKVHGLPFEGIIIYW